MREEADQLGFIKLEEIGEISSLSHYNNIKRMYIITIEKLLENKLPQELSILSNNITY